jgi:hypothetical protein
MMAGPNVSDNRGGFMTRALPAARRVAALLLVLTPVVTLAAPAPRNLTVSYGVPHALPYGVAAPDGKTGYFLTDEGCVQAVDLANGRVRWKIDDAFPLAVWDGKAVVLRRVKDKPDRVQVAVLDADGAVSLASEEITVPGHRDGAQGWWTGRAYLDGDELVLEGSVCWPSADKDSKSLLPHRTRVNLKTTRAVPLGEEQKGALRPPLRLPEKLDEAIKALPQDIHYAWGSAWYNEPRRLTDGDRLGVVWRTPVDKDEVLTLRTWDVGTGGDVWTKELLRRPFGNHLHTSDDGRYLFFQHEDRTTPDHPHRSTWRVYRVATGEHVGTFLYDGYSLCAGVVGDRVFVVEYQTAPDGHSLVPELHAMELKTGKSLWRRPAATVSYGLRLGER